jgi:hypothetical protein
MKSIYAAPSPLAFQAAAKRRTVRLSARLLIPRLQDMGGFRSYCGLARQLQRVWS